MRCRLVNLKSVVDSRGSLFVAEGGIDIPFEPKRVFYITGMEVGRNRGHHAHRAAHQVLFCLDGSLEVKTKQPQSTEEIWRLDDPSVGLYVPPLTWTVFDAISGRSLCLVLASTLYDPDDYIRNIHDFDGLGTS